MNEEQQKQEFREMMQRGFEAIRQRGGDPTWTAISSEAARRLNLGQIHRAPDRIPRARRRQLEFDRG